MEKNFSRFELCSGVNFNSIKDERFKTRRISVTMFLPLDKQTASVYALLPFVLTNSCRKYPDFTSLNQQLATLYGASLFSDVNKIGDMQTLTVGVSSMTGLRLMEKIYRLSLRSCCATSCLTRC